MSSLFDPHGAFQLHVNNNILIARLTGSWNSECAESFSENLKRHTASLTERKWGHLVILDDWELGIPEISTIITDLVSWCIENGLEKSAQVYNESMIKQYHLDKMVVEREGDFERQVFRDTRIAIKWLNKYGFKLEDNKETHIFLNL